MQSESVKRTLPGSYSEMYPSRFLKADMFKGRKITMTIKAIFGEDLRDAEDQIKQEWIVQFEEKKFEWVMNKTGAFCLFRMFGGDPHSWVNRKITLFPQAGMWFGEKGEAIRVWGSPELAEDMPITLKFMRKKSERNMVMHRVVTANAPAPIQTVPPSAAHTPTRMDEIFGLLGWNVDTQARWCKANSGLSIEEQTAKLESELDK
jgi:hypothetical protein